MPSIVTNFQDVPYLVNSIGHFGVIGLVITENDLDQFYIDDLPE